MLSTTVGKQTPEGRKARRGVPDNQRGYRLCGTYRPSAHAGKPTLRRRLALPWLQEPHSCPLGRRWVPPNAPHTARNCGPAGDTPPPSHLRLYTVSSRMLAQVRSAFFRLKALCVPRMATAFIVQLCAAAGSGSGQERQRWVAGPGGGGTLHARPGIARLQSRWQCIKPAWCTGRAAGREGAGRAVQVRTSAADPSCLALTSALGRRAALALYPRPPTLA